MRRFHSVLLIAVVTLFVWYHCIKTCISTSALLTIVYMLVYVYLRLFTTKFTISNSNIVLTASDVRCTIANTNKMDNIVTWWVRGVRYNIHQWYCCQWRSFYCFYSFSKRCAYGALMSSGLLVCSDSAVNFWLHEFLSCWHIHLVSFQCPCIDQISLDFLQLCTTKLAVDVEIDMGEVNTAKCIHWHVL